MKLQYIKNKMSVALVILATAGIVSCNKLIEIPPNPIDELPQSAVFTDSADIISAVVGVYVNFKVSGGGQNIFNGMITEYIGCASGELTYAYGNTFQTNTYIATDGTSQGFWSSAYQDIYYINDALQGIETTTAISESLKQSLLAELKMVRAMHYFYLVNLYGAVPIVTGIDYKVNAILPRSSVDSVYDFIIQDLTDARKVLTPSYPSDGRARPNLYTADALLSRVYLYREQYAQADAMASEIINSGIYSLVDLNSVFLDGSNEAIWQLPAIGTSSQTAEGTAFVPRYSAPQWQITNSVLDSFEQNDQRKTNWVGTYVNTSTEVTSFYPYKYKQYLYSATPAEGYMVFRLGEQYLIRAEALAQQNKLDSALNDLNKIRIRAGLTNSTAAGKGQILSAIMRERESELFCEWGHRWFDLKRTGDIDAVLSKIKPSWVPNAALLPVPSGEIQNDPFLTQNPGY